MFRNLGVEERQKVLIRGATPVLWRAVVNLAVKVGVVVMGMTRDKGKRGELIRIGVAEVVVKGKELLERIRSFRRHIDT